jgi:hypothetical protein
MLLTFDPTMDPPIPDEPVERPRQADAAHEQRLCALDVAGRIVAILSLGELIALEA